MKKSIVLLALAAVLVLAFATAASATSAKTWNYNQDYYSWGSYSGAGITVPTNGLTLGAGGDSVVPNSNPANSGVHGNYQTTTAKCGICHSVHRAKAGGVKLLNTATATCAGCHISGTSTVTNVVIAWGTAAAPLRGPHSSTSGACNDRACHASSPHGAGGSQYALFRQKLLNNTQYAGGAQGVDLSVAAAAANPASSGVTAAILNGLPGSNTDFTGVSDAIRVGYTCNQAECHVQTMLSVVSTGWAENREILYGDDVNLRMKTGHVSVAGIGGTAFKAAASCASCHDLVDTTTRSGYAFPHAQRATGTGQGTAQTYLWYNIGDGAGNATTPMTNANMKSWDGACLKCHRNGALTSGVGITY